MSKQEKHEQFLRFGQIIRIHGHKCLPTDQQKDQIRGIIAVKGFTDRDAKYQTFNKFKNCQFYRQTLFQILPRGTFQLVNTIEEKKKKKDNYLQLIKERIGQYIKFGEDVVFKHVDSLDYLSGSVRCSEGGLGSFKVQLSSQLQNNVIFKLFPFRSFEKEGDSIKLQSPIRIRNISNRCYVSTEKNQAKYNIVTTYSKSFTWLIHLHQKHQTLHDEDQIRTHDILYLTHTKNQGYLCIDQQKDGARGGCIKQPLEQTGYHSFTCLWQIEKWPVPQVSPFEQTDKNTLGTQNTYSLRQLLTGQYLEISKIIHSCCFIPGTQNHVVDPKQISIKSAKSNVSDFLRNNGLVKIGGPKNMTDGQIDAGEQIIIDVEDLMYRQRSPYGMNEIYFTESQSEHGFRIIKIDEQSKSQVLFILSTYEILDDFAEQLTLKTTDQFQQIVKSKKLIIIDLTLQKIISFLKNCNLNQIEQNLLPDRKKQFICMDLQICQKLFKILQRMGVKILEEIYKISKSQNDAFKLVFNRAYYLIWQIIKNNHLTKIYVCQEWLHIILDHSIQNEQQTVHDTLNELLQSNELVVTKFLKDNKNHLIHRLIDIFTLKPPHEKFLNIFRASCTSNQSPIVGNQQLILTIFFIHLESVSKFNFITNSKIRNKSQIEIDNINSTKIKIQCCISKDHKTTRSFKKFFQDSLKIDLSQTSNYFIAYLNLLADICYGRNTQAKKYVQETLIPKKGFIMGEQTQNQLTTLDTLIGILEDDQMKNTKGSINLLRAALRLINYAFVQSADQNPVLRVNRYRNIDNMQRQQLKIGPKFEIVMSFLKRSLTNFQSFYPSPINDNDPNRKQKELISFQEKRLLLTILEVLKSSLIIGYWQIKQQQYQLLPLLLNILSNLKKDILHHHDDIDTGQKQLEQFNKFKKEVSKSTPSVQLIVQCKALACQLIEIIFDFRTNNLVTQCVAVYRQLVLKMDHNDQLLNYPIDIDIDIDLIETKTNVKPRSLYDSNQWKERMAKIFQGGQGPDAEKVRNAIKMMNPLMVELSIHRDPHLFFRSLKILKRHFESKSDTLKSLLSLSIYDNENGAQLADKISLRRTFLGKLEQQNLLYSGQQGVYDEIMNFLVWLSQSIKIDCNLAREPHFSQFKNIYSHFTEESQINRFHQRLIKNMDIHPILLKFITLSKQSLSTFKIDARKVIKYVYRFLSMLVKSYKQAKNEIIGMKQKYMHHVKQQVQEIIKKENQQDRKMMIKSKFKAGSLEDNDLKYLEERDDCQAIQLLTQLYSHNKNILYNEIQMENTTIEICQMINQTPITNFYKAHILNFFRSLIYYKDKHIPINQSRILAKMQDSKKKYIYYRLEETKIAEGIEENEQLHELDIINLMNDWQLQNERMLQLSEPGVRYFLSEGQNYPVIITPQLSYFITLMNLFANLVQGTHSVNIGKCRQVHSYKKLMNILIRSTICYPIKQHLRNYINQLYYSTSIQQDLCLQIIKVEIPLIIEDLNILIVILSKKRQGKLVIVHPIRYKYFDTYIYLYLEQIAYTIHYILQDTTFMRQIQKQLANNYSRGYYYLHYYVLRIYERLRWMLNYYYQHKYIRGFLNKITNKIKDKFLVEFKETSFRVFDRNQEKNHSPKDFDTQVIRAKSQINQIRVATLKKRSKELIHKLIKGDIGSYFNQKRPQKDKNFPLAFMLPYGEQLQKLQKLQTGSRQNELSEIARKLKIILFQKNKKLINKDYHFHKLTHLENSLNQSIDFKLFMNNFMEVQCHQLYEIDQHSKKNYQFSQKFVSFQQYIKIFVNINTKKPDSISNDLKIFFFQILTQYITRFKKDDRFKPIESWTKQNWQQCEQDIKKAQIFLKNSDVAQLISQTMKKSDDNKLFSFVLEFGIAYLLGGNTQCQNSIYEKLKQDKKNQVFIKIYSMISKLGKKITNRISQRTNRYLPKHSDFTVQSLDLYDYYDTKTKAMNRYSKLEMQDRDQKDQQELEIQVFVRLFKFLQLLCQCNNFEMKHLIRQQKDQNGQKKNYSFNTINLATFQIRRLFKVMCQQACSIVIPLVDFINEVVTVPCIENQVSLCQTTFLEDLCYMASFFKDKNNLKQREFDTLNSLQMLFQIYQKCILIILNVLEGNNTSLNQSLLIKLDISFLMEIILKNLELLNVKTKEDLHEVLTNNSKQIAKVPIEIQNAINVMIVLQKLQSSQGGQKIKEKKQLYIIELYKTKGIRFDKLIHVLRQEMLRIEVLSTRGRQFIFFPKHPILTKLSTTTRDRIMIEVSRTTQREKIKSLFSFKEEIFAEIQHNFKIEKQKIFGLTFQPAKIQQLYTYSFYISYIIIIIWALTTNIIIEYHEVIYDIPYPIKPIIKTLNFLQLTVTTIYFLSYFYCKEKLAKYRAEKDEDAKKEQQERLKLLNATNKQNQNQIDNFMSRIQEKKIYQKYKQSINFITKSKLMITLKYDEKFLYVLCYLFTSLLGTFFDESLFLCYILFYFMDNQTLSNVFNAIVYNVKQLLSVSLLGLVFVYVFSLIFYQTYSLQIEKQNQDQQCSGIIACIMDLYVSGAIGSSAQTFNFLRFLTNLIYFVFFGLLFGNIVSGIMIDTFAELRNKREVMANDKRNRCYICGKDRASLQKNNQNFDQHINEKHFLWNYIYYMYCMQTKNVTLYSGLQYEITACVDCGKNQQTYIQWIPFNTEDDDGHGAQIDQLRQQILNNTMSMESKMTDFKKQFLTDSKSTLEQQEI